MKINNLNRNISIYTDNIGKNKKSDKPTDENTEVDSVKQPREDKLELSDNAKKISRIMQNIDNGVYNSDKVLDFVAERLSKDL